MFTYSQSTGELKRDGLLVGKGYSGKGSSKNNPKDQNLHGLGPIPRGRYSIGAVILVTAVHGPFVIPLTPDPKNQMWGRDGFLIHGDSVVKPGTASEGCIILDRATRKAIIQAADYDLTVTS